MLAVLAVAIITLDGDNGFHHCQCFIDRNKAQWCSQSGECLSFTMRHTHTATHQHCEAIHALAIKGSNKTNILCVNVNTVVTRGGNADLEFARQVGRAINWLSFISISKLHSLHLFTIDPNFVVGMATWSEVHGNAVSSSLYLRLCMVSNGSRAGHHVTIDITTGSQCG